MLRLEACLSLHFSCTIRFEENPCVHCLVNRSLGVALPSCVTVLSHCAERYLFHPGCRVNRRAPLLLAENQRCDEEINTGGNEDDDECSQLTRKKEPNRPLICARLGGRRCSGCGLMRGNNLN